MARRSLLPLLTLAVLGCFALPLIAQTTSGPGKTGTGEVEKPGAGPEAPKDSGPKIAAIEFPYPEGEWITYRWIRGNREVSTTQIYFLRDDKGNMGMRYQWKYEADGRRFAQVGEALLRPDLQPIRYTHTMNGKATGVGVGESVQAEFDYERGTVEITTHANVVKTEEEELPEDSHLYFRGSFFVLLAPVLHSSGDGTYTLYRPGDRKYHTLTAKKEKKEGGLTRWLVTMPGLTARVWLEENGALKKYVQESQSVAATEVERVDAPGPTEPAKDKKAPGAGKKTGEPKNG